jgi:hypothetical protein
MTDLLIRAFEMADWESAARMWLAAKCIWGTLQMPYQSRDDLKRKKENPPAGGFRDGAIVDALAMARIRL